MTSDTNTARIERWTWILIYVGMVGLGFGLALQRSDASLGWGMVIVGSALIGIGIVLIWIRSRIRIDPPSKNTPPPRSPP